MWEQLAKPDTAIILVSLFFLIERGASFLVSYRLLRSPVPIPPPVNYVTEERLKSFKEEQETILKLKLELLSVRMESVEKSNQHILRLLYRLMQKHGIEDDLT